VYGTNTGTAIFSHDLKCKQDFGLTSCSFTIFDDKRGFIANGHALWNGPLLPPLSPTEDRNALLFLTHLHLSKTGGKSSAFVSMATSLLQMMNYASAKENPLIALIDLDHESLKETNKRLDASRILADLKSLDQAQWARYKGRGEYMV
jgi:hypothetical protein